MFELIITLLIVAVILVVLFAGVSVAISYVAQADWVSPLDEDGRE